MRTKFEKKNQREHALLLGTTVFVDAQSELPVGPSEFRCVMRVTMAKSSSSSDSSVSDSETSKSQTRSVEEYR